MSDYYHTFTMHLHHDKLFLTFCVSDKYFGLINIYFLNPVSCLACYVFYFLLDVIESFFSRLAVTKSLSHLYTSPPETLVQ